MADAQVFSEDDRGELLEGEIIEMAPIGSRHAACVDRLTQVFALALGEEAIVRVQNPLRLSEHSEPQPDLAVVLPRSDHYRHAHPRAADIFFLIEVSDTTAEFDRTVKLPLYARAGIREVWIVDLAAACVEVYRQPGADGYERMERFMRGQSVAPQAFPDLFLSVNDILG